MIQKSGDYYIYDNNQATQKIPDKVSSFQERHQTVGNLKQKIQAVRQRFNKIKKEKLQLDQTTNKNKNIPIFDKVKTPSQSRVSQIEIEVFIPAEILELDQKLTKIQQNLKINEIFRRKIQNKGNLVERIRILHEKFKKVLQKSSEIIITNIQNYSSSLQDKEEYFKLLFLKEAHSKVKSSFYVTVGMQEEILVLEGYLKNLNLIQRRIQSVEPIQQTLKAHSDIIETRAIISKKIRTLFNQMKNTYQQILVQINSISC